MEMEIRTAPMAVEVRAGADGETLIVGMAARYNALSGDLGGFREVLRPGAFAERLEDDVRALWQHNPLYVLGRTVSGTLRLAEDDQGLHYEVRAPNAQWARDVIESIRRGDVSGSSFAFTVLPDGEKWDVGADGQVTRTITRIARLYDVSPATYPAYPQTDVGLQQRAADLRARAAGQAGDDMADELTRARQALRHRVDVRRRMLLD